MCLRGYVPKFVHKGEGLHISSIGGSYEGLSTLGDRQAAVQPAEPPGAPTQSGDGRHTGTELRVRQQKKLVSDSGQQPRKKGLFITNSWRGGGRTWWPLRKRPGFRGVMCDRDKRSMNPHAERAVTAEPRLAVRVCSACGSPGGLVWILGGSDVLVNYQLKNK